MPIFQFKFRYAKVLLQTPGIGSVLVCFVGLSLGAVLIFTWGRSVNGTPANPAQRAARSGPVPIASSVVAANHSASGGEVKLLTASRIRHEALRKPVRAHLNRAIFQQPIASDQLGFLNDYAGRPANDVLRERRVRQLMSMVVPYAPFHFGLDVPLPRAIEGVLSGSTMPVDIREGRYMMLSTEGERGAPRGFLWIDMQEGIAVGGIFFHPTNGEPTPTLTLFSKQVKESSLDMSQLPLAFAQDLSRWAAVAGIPPVTTRYFINASSEKSVLAHHEDFCKHAEGKPTPAKDVCRQMNADAADIDMKAADFLGQTHYASNATMRMIADQFPVGRSVAP